MTESHTLTTARPRLRHLIAVLIAAATCAIGLATVAAGPAAAAYEACPAYTSIGGGVSSYDNGSGGWAFNPSNEEVLETTGGVPCWQGSRLMCVGGVWYQADGHWFHTNAVYEPLVYEITLRQYVYSSRGSYTVPYDQGYSACDWTFQGAMAWEWCNNNDVPGGTGLFVADSLHEWNVGGSGAFNYCADGSGSGQFSRIAGTDGYIWWTNGTDWYWQTSDAEWHKY